jgi:hypothetical protein
MATKEQITDALAKLNHNDPDMWTDDGLPRTSVVQKLAGDTTIKRSDIQAASPNFSRTVPVDTDGIPLKPGSGGGGIDGGTLLAPEAPIEPTTEGSENEQMTEDEVKAILAQRVKDADHALTGAIANVAEAQRIVREAQKSVSAARAELQSAFPPLSASENIKQHLARQQERLIAQHGGQPARIDQAMAYGNSRGWGRPQRQFAMPDGSVVTAGPRTQYSRKTPDLVNKRPAARI